MIYHLFEASPYTTKFIAFIRDHSESFDVGEHVFLIRNPEGSAFGAEVGANVEVYSSKRGFWKTLNGVKEGDKVIVHGLFNPWLTLHLLLNKRALERCVWCIWGGDLYVYQTERRTFKEHADAFVRQRVISQLPIIACFIRGDYEVARRVYGARARYVHAFYPIPVDFALLARVQSAEKVRESRPPTLLVGNSGAPSNHHLEILDALAAHSGADFRIIAPLSYGDAAYSARVACYGRELFGENFVALTDFMPAERYAELLAGIDVAIMNHNRQQGLGNVLAILALGKKVYLRSDTTPYPHFNEAGIKVFDTLELKAQSLADITAFEEGTARLNSTRLRELLSEARTVEVWQEVLG